MLTERQKLILGAIIYQYTQTAKAVGSKRLQEELNIKVSSATIRNEMAVLEDADLIRKLHTSAGRVPSPYGYRYYLDHLMVSRTVTEDEVNKLLNSIQGNFHEVDDMLSETARRLADLTGMTALIIKPVDPDLKISSFQLIPLEGSQLIAILVTSDGKVTSQTFKLPKGLTVASLEGMVTYINLQMVGRSVSEVLDMMDSGKLPVQLARVIQSPAAFLQLFGEVLYRSVQQKVHLGGRLNILESGEQEFKDTTQMRRLLELFDSPQKVLQLIPHESKPVAIRIGAEIGEPLLDSYSMLSTRFGIRGHANGILALVGPIRMPYSRYALLLNAFGQALTQKMTEYV
ncbi:heat-inducible transcriptional repressor HrcA [Eupransor demetentiae]|uniref:Heat-inducible transcription repressor HrcA n=1 Tax=Eupransor demetentiae TaxID=3109584 RepID=A0ABP0EP19_9LACO|nr:Transcriptional regulator of heat shock response (HrcA) [Lactobacillaceae bacterium LMG 33000]